MFVLAPIPHLISPSQCHSRRRFKRGNGSTTPKCIRLGLTSRNTRQTQKASRVLTIINIRMTRRRTPPSRPLSRIATAVSKITTAVPRITAAVPWITTTVLRINQPFGHTPCTLLRGWFPKQLLEPGPHLHLRRRYRATCSLVYPFRALALGALGAWWALCALWTLVAWTLTRRLKWQLSTQRTVPRL